MTTLFSQACLDQALTGMIFVIAVVTVVAVIIAVVKRLTRKYRD